MSKKTLALIISLVVLTAVLLVIALTTKEQKTATDTPPAGQTATPTPAAQTVLTMTPEVIDLATSAAGTQTVNIEISTGENQVTAVQLELAFDPKVIKNLTIRPGTFFDSPSVLLPLNNNDVATGRVSYALGIAPAQDPKSGSGDVAIITFTVTPAAGVTETSLSLLSKSLVTARGVGASVLKSATGTTITLPASAAGTTQPSIQVTTAPTTPAQ
jgi:hypothetical protein